MILAVIVLPIYFVVTHERRPDPVPVFKGGQIVQMRLSGDKGMVVGHNCSRFNQTCSYDIRFSSLQMNTNVSLLGSDGPINISPVALVRYIKEFELEGI